MADSDGSAATTTAATTASSSTAYRTFRALVESADKKFARVRDLPPYDHHHHHQYDYCYRKVFKAYTRVWKFQQENRHELVESGMRRWEIGEIASRIGQLYYGQYQRTSESRFLLESYVFYEAILSRRYFEDKQNQQRRWQHQKQKPDLGLRGKELRFYARFLVVALLLNRAEVVKQLVDKFRALLDDCRVTFLDTNFKEWKLVLQEIVRFLKAYSGFPDSRPLRYNVLFDSHPLSHPHVARFHPTRALGLQEALLTGYHQNEVKFAELTLDNFRMLQSLEWEPSGSFYQKGVTESHNNGVYSDQNGASGLIDINISADMIDSNLPPNPRKAILYRPSVPQLIAIIATICEELSTDSVLLIYISASGKSDQNIAFQKENSGALRNSDMSIPSQIGSRNNTSLHQPSVHCREDPIDSCGGYLWLGSRGNSGLNKLYPADLIPFTRRPLFLIIDSDNSNAFKVIHGAERGETAVLLLSPLKPMFRSQSSADLTANGSQFTFFLTAPLQAFCQLVGLPDIDSDVYNCADSILSTALSKWEVMLCKQGCLDQVWAQVFPDPFLRRLILRFIFCRSVLYLFQHPEKGSQHLPNCLPELPDCVCPDSSSVHSSILLLAESLGVASQFQGSPHVKPS